MWYSTALPEAVSLSWKRLSSGLGRPYTLGLRISPLRCRAWEAKAVATCSGDGRSTQYSLAPSPASMQR